eukprot:746306-Hanusia_phi.AAC.1
MQVVNAYMPNYSQASYGYAGSGAITPVYQCAIADDSLECNCLVQVSYDAVGLQSFILLRVSKPSGNAVLSSPDKVFHLLLKEKSP